MLDRFELIKLSYYNDTKKSQKKIFYRYQKFKALKSFKIAFSNRFIFLFKKKSSALTTSASGIDF